jgi:aldose 1-epimerase
MSFAPASGEQYALVHGDQRAVVTEVGATLRSWQLEGCELLDTFGLDSPGNPYRGKVLMPWPNRLRDGRYSFGGREHATALSEPERGNAMHGLVTWVNWNATQRSERSVTLTYRLHAQPGYPFVLDLAVDYALSDDGLDVTLRAANPGRAAAPFGAGLHPYLALGDGRADDARLRIPAESWLPVDDQLVPTGEVRPVDGTQYDFRSRRRIGEAEIDTCFTDVTRGSDGLARVELAYDATGGERQLTVWMDGSYSDLQVYTSDDVPEPDRRRRSVAVEPMTCAPDAFNSGRGLLVLEPGEAFSGRCGIAVDRSLGQASTAAS